MNRTVATFIQARMTSTRVPGKALRPIAGTPMLGYVIERAQRVQATDGRVLVTTSYDVEDDAIVDYCASVNVPVYRGRRDDVARRMVAAADLHDVDIVVRVSGDSPLIDQSIIDNAVRVFRDGGVDLVTNVMPRSFPVGMSVEVISREALTWALRRMSSDDHHEHVTKLFYEQPELIRIANIANDTDLSQLRLTIDYPEDIARIESVFAAMTQPHWTYTMADVLALAPQLTTAAR
ncbi:MAG: NTP transferase domain-containing protein [Acidimicrobiia bacterium]